MDRLIFTSLASINERRLLREQLNNELANISTVGFKRSFDSAMTAVKAEGDPSAPPPQHAPPTTRSCVWVVCGRVLGWSWGTDG